ncbi:hypothetical protein [Noviherbaspirillum malthae]|jgi:hypothetical protein|nr:hypothetical protein [Noviherbaspirillum malthae]
MIKVLAFGILLIVSTTYAATTLVADTVAAMVKAENKSRRIAVIE